MFQVRSLVLAATSLLSVSIASTSFAAGFADAVINYSPGLGFSAGYTNAAVALGEPSRVTPGQFGGPVEPFSAPYLSSQLVSLGTNGFLTVRFDTPILNDASHPFGLDFNIYGNSGFAITNGDYSGGGITDGSLYGANPGQTRVSVSADGTNFFVLNPTYAMAVDGLFPTDGSGQFEIPVAPSLTSASFNGLSLSGIRALYAGSGGGTGYDLGWAQDTNGFSVALPSVSFVRVEVLSGKSEIDGFSVVTVPEPSTWTLVAAGVGLIWRARRRV